MTERSVASRRLGLGHWLFVAAMLALTVLFVNLGMWQLDRLAEKQAEIAMVSERIDEPPIVFPPLGQWDGLAPETLDYRPVDLEGVFDHGRTVLIFDNLTDAEGSYSGVGYWVMAPLTTTEGGVVWVNRGFVPDTMAETFADGGLGPEGQVRIEGIARRPQRVGPFTPDADIAGRREWVRNPERLALFLADPATPVAPVTVDMNADEPDALPQGGETQFTFSNRHLEYAGTWFAFAFVTVIMLGYWVWRQRRT